MNKLDKYELITHTFQIQECPQVWGTHRKRIIILQPIKQRRSSSFNKVKRWAFMASRSVNSRIYTHRPVRGIDWINDNWTCILLVIQNNLDRRRSVLLSPLILKKTNSSLHMFSSSGYLSSSLSSIDIHLPSSSSCQVLHLFTFLVISE